MNSSLQTYVALGAVSLAALWIGCRWWRLAQGRGKPACGCGSASCTIKKHPLKSKATSSDAE